METILEENTHLRIFPVGSVVMVSNRNDIGLFSLARGADVTNTTLPSGLKMPSAQNGYAWIIVSENTARLVNKVELFRLAHPV